MTTPEPLTKPETDRLDHETSAYNNPADEPNDTPPPIPEAAR